MQPPQSVLTHYGPAFERLHWRRAPLGFSGALIWRGENDSGTPQFALKVWPPGFPPTRLKQMHDWLARTTRLAFIPRVIPVLDGTTLFSDADQVWDCTRWMPGNACERPSFDEVKLGCSAIAMLHNTLRTDSQSQPCPGVLNRLRVLRDWLRSPIIFDDDAQFAPSMKFTLRRSMDIVAAAVPSLVSALEWWESVPVKLQPCVRDLRKEHVLFDDKRVTGIIDFGAMAVDHIAVDLARFLGELVGTNEPHFTAGLDAYREAGGDLEQPDGFVRLLDRTGTIGSIIVWLNRLIRERRTVSDIARVENRLIELINRVEQYAPV